MNRADPDVRATIENHRISLFAPNVVPTLYYDNIKSRQQRSRIQVVQLPVSGRYKPMLITRHPGQFHLQLPVRDQILIRSFPKLGFN
jgi:hypothetical protein